MGISRAMFAWFRRRYLDLLGSIYIYNEHRGYTSIDRILEAVRAHAPDDAAFIAAVEKHRADERKHYVMFKRWFELQGKMPLKVDRTCGHIDRFVEIMFRTGIDGLDEHSLVANDRLFERLCRVISLTERRGYRQVEILLNHPMVRQDADGMAPACDDQVGAAVPAHEVRGFHERRRRVDADDLASGGI